MTVKFGNPDVQHYAEQLTNAIELRHAIDTGEYPTNMWQGTVYVTDGKPEITTPINIRTVRGIDAPGLRVGVLHTIFGSAKWLSEHNYSNFADACIKFDRERQGIKVEGSGDSPVLP